MELKRCRLKPSRCITLQTEEANVHKQHLRNSKNMSKSNLHLGWMPKSAIEAYVVVRCAKCQDTFAIVQMYSDVHGYYETLPNNPKFIRPKGPISSKEQKSVKKQLNDENQLKTLMEGWVPGAGNPITNEDE